MSKSLETIKSALELAAGAGDVQERVTFPNGRGVSIIRNSYSSGHANGLFEVAVLDASGEMDYSTPVTDDVLGYLTVDDVLQVMLQVAELPAELES